MTRSRTLLAVVAAVVAGGAVAVPLSADAAGPGDDVVRLSLVETSIGFHSLDVPAPAADGLAGDLGVFESTLSTSTGRQVGRLEGQCTQIRADGTLDDCGVTLTVGASSLRVAGPFDPATGGTLTILGGTGAWVGAGGTDTITNRPDGTAVHALTIVKR